MQIVLGYSADRPRNFFLSFSTIIALSYFFKNFTPPSLLWTILLHRLMEEKHYLLADPPMWVISFVDGPFPQLTFTQNWIVHDLQLFIWLHSGKFTIFTNTDILTACFPFLLNRGKRSLIKHSNIDPINPVTTIIKK